MADESAKRAILRWEEPPPPRSRADGGRVSRYEAAAEELRGRPGEWGVVYEGPTFGKRNGPANALATHIRLGAVAAFAPSGDFDAACRVRDGVRTVYARYLGDGGCE